MASPENVPSGQTPVAADPPRDMQMLRQRIDELFGAWMDPWQASRPGGMSGFTPLADVEETDDAWIIDLEVPGVQKSDVTVELAGSTVVVRGERKERERKGVLRRRTRVTGDFRYEVGLPAAFDGDKIEAKLADGELVVRVPKVTPDLPRNIPVTS